jgi:hypothetical protein
MLSSIEAYSVCCGTRLRGTFSILFLFRTDVSLQPIMALGANRVWITMGGYLWLISDKVMGGTERARNLRSARPQLTG